MSDCIEESTCAQATSNNIAEELNKIAERYLRIIETHWKDDHKTPDPAIQALILYTTAIGYHIQDLFTAMVTENIPGPVIEKLAKIILDSPSYGLTEGKRIVEEANRNFHHFTNSKGTIQ